MRVLILLDPFYNIFEEKKEVKKLGLLGEGFAALDYFALGMFGMMISVGFGCLFWFLIAGLLVFLLFSNANDSTSLSSPGDGCLLDDDDLVEEFDLDLLCLLRMLRACAAVNKGGMKILVCEVELVVGFSSWVVLFLKVSILTLLILNKIFSLTNRKNCSTNIILIYIYNILRNSCFSIC